MAIPDDPAATAELVELLRWYVDMGVDEAIDERPQDRFAAARATITTGAASPSPPGEGGRRPDEGERPGQPPTNPSSALSRAFAARGAAKDAEARGQAGGTSTSPRPAPAAPLLPDAAVIAAREAAATAGTLDELRTVLERFDGCGLKRMANRLVFADGAPGATVMLVGEAPGAEEDRSGTPFVGRGGRLLDRMLGAIGLDRSKVYIANVVPWRPPGNRDPTPQEITECLPFIRRQIELADPDILVPMGKAALAALTGSKDGITRARGRWGEYHTGRRTIRSLPMLHPAYLLRQPAQKALAWRDWRTLHRALTGAA